MGNEIHTGADWRKETREFDLLRQMLKRAFVFGSPSRPRGYGAVAPTSSLGSERQVTCATISGLSLHTPSDLILKSAG